MIEELKAKIMEVLQDCGDYSNQYTPSFIQHKICHTKSNTAPAMTPVRPDSSHLITHVHELSITTYNEVCYMFLQHNIIACQLMWYNYYPMLGI